MEYGGPLEVDFLLQLLGLVLYRAGGSQTFTADEINQINQFVGRIQVTSPIGSDIITVKLTSKERGPHGANSEAK